MENIDETISKCNFDLISKFPSSFPLNAEKKGERHSFRKSRDRDDRESYESGDLIVWRTKSSWRISNSRSAQSATIIAFHDMPNQWNTCPASSRKASTEHPDAVDPLSATATSWRPAFDSRHHPASNHPLSDNASIRCVCVRARREVSPISRRGAVITRATTSKPKA